MGSDVKRKLWIVLALVVLALLCLAPTFYVATGREPPKNWFTEPIHLGLDLKGGLYLTLEVQTREAVKGELAAIGRRVKSELAKDHIGVLNPKVTPENVLQLSVLGENNLAKLQDYVRREYPNVSEVTKSTEGRRIIVNFRLAEKDMIQIERDSVERAIETLRSRIDQTGVREPIIQRSGEKRVVVQLPDLKITDTDLVKRTIGSVAKLEFYLVADPTRAGQNVVTKRVKTREGEELLLEDEVLMTGDVIERADVEVNPQEAGYQIAFRLSSSGGKIFSEITGANIGRRLAIILDGVSQSDPVIQSKIPGGHGVITGRFSAEEARLLKIVLQAGALPAPLTFLEERSVGSTLGADSIRKGLFATVVGSLLVAVFTVVYYRKSGLLAVWCLAINILLLTALLAFLGATLTLPGIAGLALTVGMAVDGSVIIYERIRDEIRVGATGKASVDAGFLKAYWTIMDANITTLLSGVVLYAFGSGPIRGFAVTLCLGILTSVFTTLFVARLGFDLFNFRDREGKLSI